MAQIDPIIRVFISSTFRDFVAERDALQERVFPDLRSYCREKGARFLPIDLRWGIAEADSLDQRTVRICLEEIRRCQNVSPSFNFVALLGDRYGSRLVPETIPEAEMRLFFEKSPDEQKFLESWYELDDNAVPPEYVLRSRSGLQEEDWEKVTFPRLQTVLIKACDSQESETYRTITTSVSEREIHAGILQLPKPSSALCIIRKFDKATDNDDFFEPGPKDPNSLDGRTQLADLKDRLREHLPDGIIDYAAKWEGNGPTSESIGHFCDLTKEHLLQRIEDALVKERRTEHAQEDLRSWNFASARLPAYTGRANDLKALQAYLAEKPKIPYVLTGRSGIGKTTLLLKVAEDALAADAQHFYYFIGGNTSVASVSALLRDLFTRLQKTHPRDKDVKLATDRNGLEDQVKEFLGRATEERPLILIVDALDQLQDANPTSWIPEILPDHVHLIVSLLSEPDTNPSALDDVDTRLSSSRHILSDMSVDDAGDLLDTWLAGVRPEHTLTDQSERTLIERRRLKSEQRTAILALFGKEPVPLYLRLLFEKARRWSSSFDQFADIPPDTERLVQDFFMKEETDDARRLLVSTALGLLAAGKNGVTEDELLEILGTDPERRRRIAQASQYVLKVDRFPAVLWALLYADIEPLLTERNLEDTQGVLGFYHRVVEKVAKERYLQPADKAARHKELAAYFGKQLVVNDPQALIGPGNLNLRKLAEQPYQQAEARQWGDLYATLTDGSFLEAQINRVKVEGLLADFALMPEGDERYQTLREIATAILTGTVVLNQEPPEERASRIPGPPSEIVNQIQGRIGKNISFSFSVERHVPRFNLDSTSLLYDPALIRVFQGNAGVLFSCAFSPDGKSIAASSSGITKLRVWDVATGRKTAEFTPESKESVTIARCVFDPAESSRILLASSDNVLRLWNITQKTLLTYNGHTGAVSDCAFSPDGQRAISASFDKSLFLWDLSDAAKPPQLLSETEGTEAVFGCAFHPMREQVLFATSDGYLHLWDEKTGPERFGERHGGSIRACAFSPDGNQAISASSDRTLRLWNVASRKHLRSFTGHIDRVNGCAFSPDGRFALSASSDGTLRLWDVASGELVYTFLGHTDEVNGCAFSPDGNQALSVSSDGTARLWSVATALERRASQRIRHAGKVNGCAFSPDGERALSASSDSTTYLWDVATGKPPRTIQDPEVKSVDVRCAFSPDGGKALVARDNATLQLWDVQRVTMVLLTGHTDSVLDCAFSPDGRQALSASVDRTLRLWEVQNGKTIAVFGGHTDSVWGCAFSPDGRRVVSASSDRTLRLWDVASRKHLRSFAEHTDAVLACAFSPNGRQILSASADATLKLWDVKSGNIVRTFEGHHDWVTGCAFSPDGEQVLSVSRDLTARLWSLADGKSLAQWQTDAQLLCCAFHPRKWRILAGDTSGGVHVLSIVESQKRGKKKWSILSFLQRS